MKQYVKMAAAIAAVMAVCLGILLLCSKSVQQPQDAVMLNDTVQTVREHIRQPETLEQIPFDTELLVFNTEDALIFATADAPDDIETLSGAVRRGYTCLAIRDGTQFLGTAAFPNLAEANLERMEQRLISSAALAFLTVLLVTAAAGFFIHKRIVKPFRNMKAFAGDIAQGNLDTPLNMEQNNLFGSFTESFDIMREELKAAKKREDALKQREKELTASLGHDIKTPVTGIKLLCELLCIKTDDAYIKGKIGSISQKAEQINLLANDLLNASLDELGELNVQCQDEASSVLQTLTEEHDPRRLVKTEPVPECLISIDRSRMSQVIGNIISNSYKYANTQIEVTYAFADSFLEMRISDHGGGIPEEETELITKKYYRGKSNSGGKDGSGLGLYIAAELMEKMQGELCCKNSGDGLTVILMIALS